jgi:hypothetical protein
MNWTENYGVHKARVGFVQLVLEYEHRQGGFKVSVNDRVLSKRFNSLEEGKATAVKFARKLLNEALEALDA